MSVAVGCILDSLLNQDVGSLLVIISSEPRCRLFY